MVPPRVLFLLLSAALRLASCQPQPSKPNILLILADDLRPDLLGSYGSSVYRDLGITPNLDALAREGTRFNSAWTAAPLCAPSRFSMVTGHYNSRKSRTNGHTFHPPELKLARPTYFVDNNGFINGETAAFYKQRTTGALLRQHGYRTGGVGKWHMGIQLHEAAFNYSYLLITNSEDCERFGVRKGAPLHNPEETTEQAVRFIEQSATDPSPWFLHLAYTIPHAPYEMDIILEQDFLTGQEPFLGPADRDERGLRPLHLSEERRNHVAQGRNQLREFLKQKGLYNTQGGGGHGHFTSLGAIAWLDKEVGEVLEALRRAGAESNTLVVFSADHGVVQFLGIGKGSPFNEGARVPLLARWPAGGVNAGSVYRDPVSLVDLLPTFLEVSGAPHLPDLDGLSLVSAMRGTAMPERSVFIESGYSRAVVRGGWKLIITNAEDIDKKGPCSWAYSDYIAQVPARLERQYICHAQMCREEQLYRYAEDCEQEDVSQMNPDTAQLLRAELDQHMARTNDIRVPNATQQSFLVRRTKTNSKRARQAPFDFNAPAAFEAKGQLGCYDRFASVSSPRCDSRWHSVFDTN